METSDDLVIGVDAGGTKTTAWLASLRPERDDQPLGAGAAGPGNPRATGFEPATREIGEAIKQAFATASLPPAPVAAICLSVAGAGRTEEQQRLTTWASSQQLARRVVVTNDAEPIVAAASTDNTGIALISGTGSLAWGRSTDGRVDRAGGWGYLFGDEGSGYAIAVAGLRAATHAADGRGGETALLNGFMQRLNVVTPRKLIESIYGAELSRQQIAAMADVVFGAGPNDEVARGILDTASTDLAQMVTSLANKLKFTTSVLTLGLAGGVLMSQPSFRSTLIKKIGLPPNQAVDVISPVAGSVKIARRLAIGGPSEFDTDKHGAGESPDL